MSWRPAWRLPGRIPLRLRVFFRGAFFLLALATVALALSVLQEEKQLSWRNYQDGFTKNQAQIAARLRHPTGQLALLNPGARSAGVTPLRPLVLPFSAIDFDDKAKAQQAVEMAGCLVQYRDAQLCVAVGNNPLAGGFIYTVGSFASGALVARAPGELDLSLAHRARVTVQMRGQSFRWIAPFEQAAGDGSGLGTRGRLTGFVEGASGPAATRPVRDFRGWLWQDGRCAGDAAPAAGTGCLKRSFFSIRLPIELFRDELFQKTLVWPPPDLDQIQVRVQLLPPGDGPALFDSDSPGATPPFALADLTPLLLPGETLRIRKLGAAAGAPDLVTLKGQEDTTQTTSPWLLRLIRQLPVEAYEQPVAARELIATPLGEYELLLTGDLRTVNRGLGVVATRVSWFVGAMLAAIVLTWAAIELRMIRRITLLTKRAAAVSGSVKGHDGLVQLDLSELRGSDELGLLADVLAELMQRVNDDVRREHIRVEQEKDQWHAVGHEIMSPLQSLMVLHADPADPSQRYISRMQQALRVLYGSASPSEAFQSTTLQVQAMDLRAFLQHVADNAASAGLPGVVLQAAPGPVMVRADEYSLEDVVTHVLRNADRYRPAGTPLTITLATTETRSEATAEVTLHNQGEPIPAELIDTIFEYGVSDQPDAAALGHRGQGLFVARTYMAKMGGTIGAHNTADGVCFVLRLQRVAGPAAG
ncbi:MAG TPA: HAMP domain-containing sensor histidine kinase [Ideonella sp.]|nr:HAMP domain-containing sensor histidine kinase [Ideonella sp.]